MPDQETTIAAVAPAFVEMAHQIVWASAATVDARNRPRTRVLHPLWDWDGARLSGVIATGPTPAKVKDLDHSPHVSLSYWAPNQDTCRADCNTSWSFDDETCMQVWDRFKNAPSPVGYDPAMIPPWAESGPTGDAFAVLHLEPYRIRVFPGTLLLSGTGDLLSWRA